MQTFTVTLEQLLTSIFKSIELISIMELDKLAFHIFTVSRKMQTILTKVCSLLKGTLPTEMMYVSERERERERENVRITSSFIILLHVLSCDVMTADGLLIGNRI
jgi:hypothetical protein